MTTSVIPRMAMFLQFLCVFFCIYKLNGLMEDEEKLSVKTFITVLDALVLSGLTVSTTAAAMTYSHLHLYDLPSRYSHCASPAP